MLRSTPAPGSKLSACVITGAQRGLDLPQQLGSYFSLSNLRCLSSQDGEENSVLRWSSARVSENVIKRGRVFVRKPPVTYIECPFRLIVQWCTHTLFFESCRQSCFRHLSFTSAASFALNKLEQTHISSFFAFVYSAPTCHLFHLFIYFLRLFLWLPKRHFAVRLGKQTGTLS